MMNVGPVPQSSDQVTSHTAGMPRLPATPTSTSTSTSLSYLCVHFSPAAPLREIYRQNGASIYSSSMYSSISPLQNLTCPRTSSKCNSSCPSHASAWSNKRTLQKQSSNVEKWHNSSKYAQHSLGFLPFNISTQPKRKPNLTSTPTGWQDPIRPNTC